MLCSQSLGFSVDGLGSKGLFNMHETIPYNKKGFGIGAFYTFPNEIISVGYRFCYDRYGKSILNNARGSYNPGGYYNVSNAHRLFENTLLVRFGDISEDVASPFVEAGVGYASFKSVAIRDYCSVPTHVHVSSHKQRHHYFSDRTFYSQISAGMNFKANGIWFTIGIDYIFGKNVNYLNSVVNQRQFYNNFSLPYNTNSPSVNLPKNYLDQSVYNAPLRLIQLRLGITLIIEDI
jgi:hypothetical protein